VVGKGKEGWGQVLCSPPSYKDLTPTSEYRRMLLLESSEARIGTLVGVIDGAKRLGRGRVGTIEHTYGHPEYLAMDVRFEDGSVELYWYHELEKTKVSSSA
jgi:hypothetical protein